jgi:glycosyltransferase involved in cell wall biosynthesis
VAEADLSVFCAKARADEMRSKVPEAMDRIIHLPHGAPAINIAPKPLHSPTAPPLDIANLPRPLLGFVGSLEDRIDWPLLTSLADAFPNGSIVLVGREPDSKPGKPWYREARSTLMRSNVHAIGWRPQSVLGRYNASFDVCMIPYLPDHPFNRASCPTKVMDYMATSRPVVSSAVPECRLYSDVFHVANTQAEFIAAVDRIVKRASDDGRAAARWKIAHDRTWERTAESLLDQIVAHVGGSSSAHHAASPRGNGSSNLE